MLAEAAESAIFGVNEAVGQLPRRPRWSWRAWERVEARAHRLQMELAYPRFIGAAENYLVVHVTRTVKPELLEQLAPPEKVDDKTKKLRDAVRNFNTLRRLWADEFNVDLSGLLSWSDFEKCRDVRHVLIHRLGRWEPGLDPKPSLAGRIAALGRSPKTYRGEFPLSLGDCHECARLSRAIVTECESELGRP